jgi:diacylglycerol kinase family enzyme
VGAIVALLATVALLVITVVVLAVHLLWLPLAVACMILAVGAASYAVTRVGVRRVVAAAVALLAILAPIVLVVVYGQVLLVLAMVALAALTGTATRRALGRDIASLKSGPAPGVAVEAAVRPVLLMNPGSGGGKVERFGLVEQARRRGIEPVVLRPGDDLVRLAEEAVAGGADVIGMAGGDGSQALVASVAAAHGIAFVCVPAGTRNHLAMDLGLDRDDVVGALEAFGAAVERCIDLGVAGDRVFVNNATMGLYAKIVQSPAYRAHKLGTTLELLPAMLGPRAIPFDLRFTGPDGTEHPSAHLIMVSNNRYDLSAGEAFGSRRRIDAGTLGIVAVRFQSSGEVARFVELEAAGQPRRFPGWSEWTDTGFEVRSGQPVEIGIDGEAMLLEPPIRFQVRPGALRVRIPPHAPGHSPAAAAPTPGWSTVTALLRTAAGRPVAMQM